MHVFYEEGFHQGDFVLNNENAKTAINLFHMPGLSHDRVETPLFASIVRSSMISEQVGDPNTLIPTMLPPACVRLTRIYPSTQMQLRVLELGGAKGHQVHNSPHRKLEKGRCD